jgi:hypothetical protein
VAGVVRIVFGVLFLLAGIFFFLTLIGIFLGILFVIIGFVLLASGVSARGDADRISQQQAQTNMLLQQQIAMNAAQTNRPIYVQPPQQYAPAPPPAPGASQRFCPSCGAGGQMAGGFCSYCGKPVPR